LEQHVDNPDREPLVPWEHGFYASVNVVNTVNPQHVDGISDLFYYTVLNSTEYAIYVQTGRLDNHRNYDKRNYHASARYAIRHYFDLALHSRDPYYQSRHDELYLLAIRFPTEYLCSLYINQCISSFNRGWYAMSVFTVNNTPLYVSQRAKVYTEVFRFTVDYVDALNVLRSHGYLLRYTAWFHVNMVGNAEVVHTLGYINHLTAYDR